jgi:endonuclease G
LYKFIVATGKIEQLTKIYYFPKLDDALENKLEKSSDYKDWNFN